MMATLLIRLGSARRCSRLGSARPSSELGSARLGHMSDKNLYLVVIQECVCSTGTKSLMNRAHTAQNEKDTFREQVEYAL